MLTMKLFKANVVFVLISILVIHCDSHPMKRSAENEDHAASTIDPDITNNSVGLDCYESASSPDDSDSSESSDSTDDSSNSESSDSSDDSSNSESSDLSDSSVCLEPTSTTPNDENSAREVDDESTDEPIN